MPTRRVLLAGAAALPLLPGLALAQTRHAVRIAGMAFNPADIAIRAGDSVVFTNEDGAPHTATAEDGSWDTGRLDRGASAELGFSSPGAYPYRCAFHPSMRGRVIVS
jgi:plastocyanin